MVKKNRRSRRTTAAAAPAATHQNPDESHKAPTPGLRDIVFTEGSAQDAARFEENLRTLASYVGTQAWSQSSEIAKAMLELQAPVHVEPEKPTRSYYVFREPGGAVPVPPETTDVFRADGTTPNVPVVDDYEYKEKWHEYGKDKEQYKRRQRDWTENNARVYHLVLLHCGPALTADLMNHSTWLAGQRAQNCIAFLLMIRD